eukprot:TRINITY_DN46898_c0_g1_i1.p1 TRINITY_DN46898_c0_g1~~TRINITY_DN46898_c0_g1_i1.p1  ORF type:complete len:943 (+),score=202.15 TRINITY_DN46898_c0_g1_i1:73-2901(+)
MAARAALTTALLVGAVCGDSVGVGPTLWQMVQLLTDPSKAPPGCQPVAKAMAKPACRACVRAAGGSDMLRTGGLAADTFCGQCIRQPKAQICKQCLRQVNLSSVYPSVDEGYLSGLNKVLPIRADVACGEWPKSNGWGCCRVLDPGCHDTMQGEEAYLAWASYSGEFPKAAPGRAALPYESAEECSDNCAKLAHLSWPPSVTCCYANRLGCFVKPAAVADGNPQNSHLRKAVNCEPQPLGFAVDDLGTVTFVGAGSAAAKAGVEVGHRLTKVDLAADGTFHIAEASCPDCCPRNSGNDQVKCATLQELTRPIPLAQMGMSPPTQRPPGLADWAFTPGGEGLQTALHVEVSPCATCIAGLPELDDFIEKCLVQLPLNPPCRNCARSLPHASTDCQVCHQTGTRCEPCLDTVLDYTDQCRDCWRTLPDSFPAETCSTFSTIAPSCGPCIDRDLKAAEPDSLCGRCVSAGEGIHCMGCWESMPTLSHNCAACRSQMPSDAAFGVCVKNLKISDECGYCLAELPKLDPECGTCSKSGLRSACAACWARAPHLATVCGECMPLYTAYFPTEPCRAGTECLTYLGRQFLWIGFIVMVTGYLRFTHSVMQRGGGDGSYYAFLTATPCGVGAVAYLCMCCGLGSYTVGDGMLGYGRVVFWVRFVDWALTMPLQVWCLCVLAWASASTTRYLCSLIVFSVVAALCGSLHTGMFQYVFYGVALVLFLPLVAQLAALHRSAAEREQSDREQLFAVANKVHGVSGGRTSGMFSPVLSPQMSSSRNLLLSTASRRGLTQDDVEQLEDFSEQLCNEVEALGLYRQLARLTLVAFVCYPVAWTCRGTSIISLDVEAVLYFVLDLCLRIVFGMAVMRCRDRVDRVGRPSEPDSPSARRAKTHLYTMRQCESLLCCFRLNLTSSIPDGPADRPKIVPVAYYGSTGVPIERRPDALRSSL